MSDAIGPVAGGIVGGPVGALVGYTAQQALQKPESPPPPGQGPTPPNQTDAARQAALDEQKRAALAGPGSLTNVGGAQGILTDPNAKYTRNQLLGGA